MAKYLYGIQKQKKSRKFFFIFHIFWKSSICCNSNFETLRCYNLQNFLVFKKKNECSKLFKQKYIDTFFKNKM